MPAHIVDTPPLARFIDLRTLVLASASTSVSMQASKAIHDISAKKLRADENYDKRSSAYELIKELCEMHINKKLQKILNANGCKVEDVISISCDKKEPVDLLFPVKSLS